MELDDLPLMLHTREIPRLAKKRETEHIDHKARQGPGIAGEDIQTDPAQGPSQRRTIHRGVIHIRPHRRITPPLVVRPSR